MSPLRSAALSYLDATDSTTATATQRNAALTALRKAATDKTRSFGADDLLKVTVAAMQGLLAGPSKRQLAPKGLAKKAEQYAKAVIIGLEDGLD